MRAPSRSVRTLVWIALPLAFLSLISSWKASASEAAVAIPNAVAKGLSEIDAKDIERHVRWLAAPEREGRDTPSRGLFSAAQYVARAFAEAGLEPWGRLQADVDLDAGSNAGPSAESGGAGADDFLWMWTLNSEGPDAGACRLELESDEGSETFELGRDYVPMLEFDGEASGELVFLGYGIRDKGERFDELDGLRLEGKIGLLFHGEPMHKKKFDGPEISESGSLWRKVRDLREAGLAGLIVVRRPLPGDDGDDGKGDAEELGYRYSVALWQGEPLESIPSKQRRLPVVEVSLRVAERLVGGTPEDGALAWIDAVDHRLRPQSRDLAGRRVHLNSATSWSEVEVHNVMGFVRGRDPELADEFVVVGGHHDHIGVDPRGRIGTGADDNASGTSAVLELAQAFASAPPRRSVILVTFSAEEDGLIGSKTLCGRLPVPDESIVAMVNLDMLGRGKADAAAVMGAGETKGFEGLLKQAKRLARTGVKKLDIADNERNGLFKRSDHYSFHEIGIPTLFFFEGLPITKNEDYHTWRDGPELVDFKKIANTTKLAFNTAWLLAEEDERYELSARRRR